MNLLVCLITLALTGSQGVYKSPAELQQAEAQIKKATCLEAKAVVASGPVAARQSQSITVTGKLTNEGVECKAMRGDDGKLYTLTGDLKGFKPGDRVKVTGRVAEMSSCMQGTTLGVEKIERAK
jgi:hypothetical protein